MDRISFRNALISIFSLEGSFSDTYCRFYNYSLYNQMLILSQGLREPIATYKVWQNLGRQVKKGEKSKAILRPISYKNKQSGNYDFAGFRMVNCIFGYSQTEGKDLDFSNDSWNKDLALETLGICMIPYDNLNGNSQGFCSEKGISVNPVARYPFKTLFHEMAHFLMDHIISNKTKEIKEVEAEICAHLLCKELNLDFDSSESRAYIQSWKNFTELPEDSCKAILRVCDQIIKAGKEKSHFETDSAPN